MPLPKPKEKETREDFISRCMSDDKTTYEFPTTEQRLAVCNSQFKTNNKKEKYSMNDIEAMGQAIKSLTDVISSKNKVGDGSNAKPKKPESEAFIGISAMADKDVDHFDREDAADARAGEIGCTGTHRVDEDGSTFYMPCGSHDEYLQAVSKSNTKPKKSVCVCNSDGICQCDTEIKKLVFHSEIKAESEKGIFTGYGSIFGNEDQGSDIMQQGAFTKSLKDRPANKVKMLYQHKTDEPIGVFTNMYEDQKGLFVQGQLAMGTQRGREAYELLKMGALDGMSIGFRADPEKQGYNENKRGVRTLKEVDLMEISLVTFPMNESALIETVKGDAKNIREWEKILREAGGLSRTEAKIGAKALSESLSQRDAVDDNKQLATLINKVANILKQ
jgi:HK97 family phage prohead protease